MTENPYVFIQVRIKLKEELQRPGWDILFPHPSQSTYKRKSSHSRNLKVENTICFFFFPETFLSVPFMGESWFSSTNTLFLVGFLWNKITFLSRFHDNIISHSDLVGHLSFLECLGSLGWMSLGSLGLGWINTPSTRGWCILLNLLQYSAYEVGLSALGQECL